jgi:hypothetical protein
VKLRIEIGCQAVLSTKKMPYITDEIEIRLKDMEVAIGAPIKPILTGSGPHTRRLYELPIEP